MLRKIFTTLLLIAGMQVNAQEKKVKTIDSENGSVVYNGLLDFDDLQNEPTFDWYHSGIESYNPQEEVVISLEKVLPSYSIVVLLGTWCEDSQNLLPKLYKILTLSNYPTEKIRLIGVDRNKTAVNDLQKPYNADRVPTVILYKGNQEKGRIVELVKTSVEKDMLDIITSE